MEVPNKKAQVTVVFCCVHYVILKENEPEYFYELFDRHKMVPGDVRLFGSKGQQKVAVVFTSTLKEWLPQALNKIQKIKGLRSILFPAEPDVKCDFYKKLIDKFDESLPLIKVYVEEIKIVKVPVGNNKLNTMLPKLYSIDSKGKERFWTCHVNKDTIYREYGLVTGKCIKSERKFEGKSIGRSNETSAYEQAMIEADKEWVSHIDKGYYPGKNDNEGKKRLEKLLEMKSKSGGHNINAASTSSNTRKEKNITRKKEDTYIVDDVKDGNIIPMKAEVWELGDSDDHSSVLPKVTKYFTKCEGVGKNMTQFPIDYYGQPKFDGWRCLIRIQPSSIKGEYNIIMTSNSGKQYPWFGSLRKVFLEWLSQSNVDKNDMLDGLDGELWAENLYNTDGTYISESERFSAICSICGLARSQPHEIEDQIKFHCFDLADVSGKYTQVERFEKLNKLFDTIKNPDHLKRIIKTKTTILHDVDEASEYHDERVREGYEGAIFRSFGMKYKVGKRSAEMRKFKYFLDEEYEIIGCKLDKGVAMEHFVWILTTEDGKTFNAKPKGTREEKHDIYKNQQKYVGKFITVTFQEYSGDKIPRFPIAKEFRKGKSTD